MAGPEPDYPRPGPSPPPLRFHENHRLAVRFAEAASGRDVAAELLAAYRAAEEDSVRLVLGTVLHGLGALSPGPQVLSRWLLEGAAAEREMAVRRLASSAGEDGFWRPAAGAAERAQEVELVRHLLRIVSGAAESWPPVLGLPGDRPPSVRYFGDGGPAFLVVDSLPEHLRAALPPGVEPVTAEAWRERDLRREARLITLHDPVWAGPFFRLVVRFDASLERTAEQNPHLYAGGYTLILLRTEAGWRLVSVGGWIT
jgi:hypothetical protein